MKNSGFHAGGPLNKGQVAGDGSLRAPFQEIPRADGARALFLKFAPLALGLAFGLAGGRLQAQGDILTAPVGYHAITIKGGADNFLSMPFPADLADMGKATSVDATSLTDSNATWTVNQWQYTTNSGKSYYVQLKDGALQGVFYTVASNSVNRIFLDTEGDSLVAHPLGAVTNGDIFNVVPYWRIRDLFANTNGAGTFLTVRPSQFLVKDDILVFPAALIGINKSASALFYYLNTNGWRQTGTNNFYAGDTIVPPGSSLIVRRRNTNDLNAVFSGRVLTQNHVAFVRSGTNTAANDNLVSVSFPAPISLNNSGLISNGAFRISTSDLVRQDELIDFGSPSGFNPSAANIYYYLTNSTQNGWRKVGSGASADFGTNTLDPGKAYVIRKKPAAADADWVQSPLY